MRSTKVLAAIIVLIGSLGVGPTLASSQQLSKFERERVQQMLRDIASDVRKHYYDPKFHGLDWDARVQESKEKIGKAETLGMALSQVAAALYELGDSHTFFLPPARPYRLDNGWEMQMVGDRCYVGQVRPQGDAESKSIKPGDLILKVNGFVPTRADFWMIGYVFSTLRPQRSMRLELQDPAGNRREVDVTAKFTELKRVADLTAEGGGGDIWQMVRESENEQRLMRARTVEYKDHEEVLFLKFPHFMFSESEVNTIMDRIRKHKALVLDLRGNSGGNVEILKQFAGDMFEKEVKIGDRVGRVLNKPMLTKGRGGPFTGKLIVLVDSRSASAAELFARVAQIEKRAVVVGDRTSGSVMEAKRYSYSVGQETKVFFGASITDADVVMTDGKSLEHAGVTPDEIVLPTAADLAGGRDPVMARAAELAGVKLSPEAAGKMFPYEWPKN